MPLYIEIMESLLEDINTGKYLPGDALPTEEELRIAYGASRTSIRNSLRELQDRGFIDKRRGSGNYVRKRLLPEEIERTVNIGLIADLYEGKDESGLFASTSSRKIVLGIQKAIKRENANLTIAIYHRNSKTPGNEINSGYPVDGFLDLGGTISEPLNKYFEASSSKVVSIRPSHNLYKFNYSNPLVIMDECEGIRQALRYYRERGFSKFGYVGVAENGLRNFRMFQSVFKEERCFFDRSCVIIYPEVSGNIINLWERTQHIATNILKSEMKPDVFFFDGLTVADYLMKYMIEKNTGFEKKVKFCAFGLVEDIENSFIFDVIEPQYREAGEKAVELLFEYIKNGDVKQNRVSVPSIFVPNQ